MPGLSGIGVTEGWRWPLFSFRRTVAGLPEKRREHEPAKAAKPATEKEVKHLSPGLLRGTEPQRDYQDGQQSQLDEGRMRVAG